MNGPSEALDSFHELSPNEYDNKVMLYLNVGQVLNARNGLSEAYDHFTISPSLPMERTCRGWQGNVVWRPFIMRLGLNACERKVGGGRKMRIFPFNHISFIKLYGRPLSVSSTGDTTGRQRKRDNLLTEEGEVEERNNNSILSVSGQLEPTSQ